MAAGEGGVRANPSNGGAAGNEGLAGAGGYGGEVPDVAPLAPSAFAGLVLWLEASPASCSEVSNGGAGGGGSFECLDASGHGNHATQPDVARAPQLVENVIHGHAALRLHGNPSCLVVDDAESLHLGQQPFSMVLVGRWHNTEIPTQVYSGAAFLIHKTTFDYPFSGITLWANYPQIFAGVPAMTRFAAQLQQGTAFALSSSNHLNDDRFRIYAVRRTSATEMEVRINGRSEGRAQIAAALDISAEGQPMIIGGYENAAVAGDLAELALIAGTVSDAEQERLERFLLDKYGLSAAKSQ